MPCRERFPNRSHPAPPGKSRFFQAARSPGGFLFSLGGKAPFLPPSAAGGLLPGGSRGLPFRRRASFRAYQCAAASSGRIERLICLGGSRRAGTLQSGFSCGFAAIHLLTSSRRVTACTICLGGSRRAGCPHPAAVNRCISFKPVLLMGRCGWGAFRLLQLALQERREILCSPSEGGGGWCPDSFSPSAAFIFPSPVNLTKLFYASVSFFGILYMIGEERRDCRPFFRKRTVFSVSARSAPFTERM